MDPRPLRLLLLAGAAALVGHSAGLGFQPGLATVEGWLWTAVLDWAQQIDDQPVVSAGLLLACVLGLIVGARRLPETPWAQPLSRLCSGLLGALQWGSVLGLVAVGLLIRPLWLIVLLGLGVLWPRVSPLPTRPDSGSQRLWLVATVGAAFGLPWLLRVFLFGDAHSLPWYPGDCPPGPPIVLWAVLPLAGCLGLLLSAQALRSGLRRRVLVLLSVAALLGMGRGLVLGWEVGAASAGLLVLGLSGIARLRDLSFPALPRLDEGLASGGLSWAAAGLASAAALSLAVVADFQAAPDRDAAGVELVADHCSPATMALGPGGLLALTEPDPPFVEVYPLDAAESEPFPLRSPPTDGLASFLVATAQSGRFWAFAPGDAADGSMGLDPSHTQPLLVDTGSGQIRPGPSPIPCRVRGVAEDRSRGRALANCEGSHRVYALDLHSGAVEDLFGLAFDTALAPLGDRWDEAPGLWLEGDLLYSLHEQWGTSLLAIDPSNGLVREDRAVGSGIASLLLDSVNQRLLAFRPRSSSILVLDAASLSVLGLWRVGFGVRAGVVLSLPGQDLLATASLLEPAVNFRRLDTGESVLRLRLGGQVRSLLAENSSTLLLAGPNGTFRVDAQALFEDLDQ